MKEDEETIMDEYSIADWEKIWSDQEDSSSPKEVSSSLITHFDKLLPSGTGSVFLPLCGQTSDLRWLYDRGCSVVGLDGAQSAVAVLLKRNSDLCFSEEKMADGAPLYKSRDGRLQLVVNDVTAATVRSLGPFDAVYDYGSYTAIRPIDRPGYLSTVFATLKPVYRCLLEFCHGISPDCTDGPHSINFRTVKRELGADKKLDFLETNDLSESYEVESMFQTFVLITPKTK